MKIITWLKGKKVYLLGLGVVAFGLYNHFFGDNLGWQETMEYIFDGSALMAFRAAVAKVGISTK